MKTQIVGGLAVLLLSGTASAAKWSVEITNVTPGQTFTPILATTHFSGIDLFEPGQPASDELAALAEAGDTGPLTAVLEFSCYVVGDIQNTGGLLMPGHSVTLTVKGRIGQRLSLAGMLIPTNDTFVGVDSVFLPPYGMTQIEAIAWDAGTEANDQNCANIPGPRCGGAALSAPADSDEGFVHVSNGFHDLGAGDGSGEVLSPAHYTWNNPVAIITIRRVR